MIVKVNPTLFVEQFLFDDILDYQCVYTGDSNKGSFTRQKDTHTPQTNILWIRTIH